MIAINQEKLQTLIREYKEDFKENISVELYKWEAVKHFQDNWDIDAEDFPTMLSQSLSKTANLLASMSSFPRGMIVQFAERFPEEVKALFASLFDETKDLKDRIDTFIVGIEQIHKKWDGKEAKNHYQNLNAISTYLWLRYPDKYYIFKPSVAKNMFEKMGAGAIKTNKVDALIKTYELYDSILDILLKDEELKEMFSATLTDNCYPDTKMKTALVDFAYFFSKDYIVRRHLLKKFLETFPYETLSTMPIEQYTNLNKTSFCYWLEQETSNLGSISGSTSFKFGIYRYYKSVADSKKDYGYDDQYAWYKAYGENASDAYNLVRDSIVQIATLAKEGKFEEIDKFERLGTLVKWKIAFMYSNASLIPVFSRDMLECCAKKFGMENTQNATFAEMQRYLLNKKGNIEIFQWYEFYKVVEEYKKQGDLKELFDAVQKNIDEEYKVTKRSKRFAWIETNDSVIGNSKCHYELCADENNKAGHKKGHIYVEAHFETDESAIFQSLKEIEGVSDFPWGPSAKHYAVRINNDGWEIDKYETKEIADILIEEIGKLDTLIGNEIRKIMGVKRYWLYAPGENASKWGRCQEQGVMCIGWNPMSDLSDIESIEDARIKLREVYNMPEASFTNDGRAIWEFAKEIQIGDIIFAKSGITKIIGRGIVKSDYFYDPEQEDYRHVRKVEWTHVGEWPVEKLALKTLTDISENKYPGYAKKLENMILGEEKQTTPIKDPQYWWLVAAPDVWKFSDISAGEVIEYTLLNENGNKRRVYQNFLDAKAGDLVIGYASTPTLQVVALGEIAKDTDDKHLYFRKTEQLLNPIDYSIIKANEELQGMECMAGGGRGTLFKVKEEEYEILMEIIRKENPSSSTSTLEAYTDKEFLDEVFMSSSELKRLKALLKEKKNIILQGAPGVGKTFTAKRLAYTLMGVKDEQRVEMVQFHQNYSYEDFILGYKPNSEGGFELKHGVFYKFCKKALNSPDKDFFFIIDEINRGNLSKIFGELLMLIENGYRGQKIKLAYTDELFTVPKNLYIIGMMNTADRSLAMIDYALRRRFSFFEMKPGFATDGFKKYQALLAHEKLDNIIEGIQVLNETISKDDSLGNGFCIGHSYFCEQKTFSLEWLENVIEYDIEPMLKEYWFDDVQKYESHINKLRNLLK